MIGIGEVSSHGSGKVPGYEVRPWRRATGDARVKNVTSRNYHKTPFLRGFRRRHHVSG